MSRQQIFSFPRDIHVSFAIKGAKNRSVAFDAIRSCAKSILISSRTSAPIAGWIPLSSKKMNFWGNLQKMKFKRKGIFSSQRLLLLVWLKDVIFKENITKWTFTDEDNIEMRKLKIFYFHKKGKRKRERKSLRNCFWNFWWRNDNRSN